VIHEAYLALEIILTEEIVVVKHVIRHHERAKQTRIDPVKMSTRATLLFEKVRRELILLFLFLIQVEIPLFL
jgi:hypothetical protein